MTPAKKTGALKVRSGSETVEDYLAAVRPDARAALVKLRKAIKAAVTKLVRARIAENRKRGYR